MGSTPVGVTLWEGEGGGVPLPASVPQRWGRAGAPPGLAAGQARAGGAVPGRTPSPSAGSRGGGGMCPRELRTSPHRGGGWGGEGVPPRSSPGAHFLPPPPNPPTQPR